MLLGARQIRETEEQPQAVAKPDRTLNRVIFLWFLTLGVVLFEPAPFDVLFVPVVIWSLLSGKITLAPRFSFLGLSLIAFLIVNVCSLMVADDLERASFFVTITAYMILLGIFCSAYVRRYSYDAITTMMNACVVVAAASAVIGCMGTLGLLPAGLAEVVTAFGGRAKGLFKDPNVYAPFLGFAFIYIVNQLATQKKRRLVNIAFLMLLGIGILVGFSRAAWISTLFSVVVYFLLSALVERKFSKIFLYLFGLIVVSALMGGVLFFFIQQTDLGEFVERRTSLQSYDTYRFLVQDLEIQEGLEHFWGIGPGQSEIVYAKYGAEGSGCAQSIYVRVLGENGLLGAIAFGSTLLLTGLRSLALCFKGSRERLGIHCMLASAYFSTLLASTVIDTLHWRHFFINIGMIWGLSFIKKNGIKKAHL